MMSLNEDDFNDAKHQCVITCPPDERLLTKGDKILVLRPFEQSPKDLHLGHSSSSLLHLEKDRKEKERKQKNEEESRHLGIRGGNRKGIAGSSQNKVKVSGSSITKSAYSFIGDVVVVEDYLDDLTRLTDDI